MKILPTLDPGFSIARVTMKAMHAVRGQDLDTGSLFRRQKLRKAESFVVKVVLTTTLASTVGIPGNDTAYVLGNDAITGLIRRLIQ